MIGTLLEEFGKTMPTNQEAGTWSWSQCSPTPNASADAATASPVQVD